MKRINIMTSCDDNYALLIMPQLASISINLTEYDVHFFLVHYRISAENVKQLRDYAETLGNITFHEVIMTNAGDFEPLLKRGGPFPAEGYIFLNCHALLPQDIDRVLNIDAGDVIINEDISSFYFDDFEDKAFNVTPTIFGVKESDGQFRVFDKGDLDNLDRVEAIRTGYINTGCIMLNLKKLRTYEDILPERYVRLTDKVIDMGLAPLNDEFGEHYFWGGQTVFELSFLEDTKIFGYDEIVRHSAISHTIGAYEYAFNIYHPMHFVFGYTETDCINMYIPAVLHYASGTRPSKPWNLSAFQDQLSLAQINLYMLWWEYASLTPLAAYPPKTFKINEKNFSRINPLQFWANWHLAHGEYDKALENINEALELATLNSPSFHALWQLKLRTILTNPNNENPFQDAINIADEYLGISRVSYMHVYMYYYKGFCLQMSGRYSEAISAYRQSETLRKAEDTFPACELTLFPFDPTAAFGTRTPIQNIDSATRIGECLEAGRLRF